MGDEGDAVRKARNLRASRDRGKRRSAEKQQQIRQLRVTNRDLSTSRDRWKARVKELEQQLRAVHATAKRLSGNPFVDLQGLMAISESEALPPPRETHSFGHT